MALPLPQSPLVLPTFDQDRGTILFDTTTKSTKQKVNIYAKDDVCDQEAYIVVGNALSINQLTTDCRTVLAASGSISLTLPRNATDADVDVVINALVADIKAQIPLA